MGAGTGSGAHVPEALEQWASGHETSYEIALAIDEICKTPSKMERVWQNPTPAEERRIIARAWTWAGETEILHWGENRIHRSEISQPTTPGTGTPENGDTGNIDRGRMQPSGKLRGGNHENI